MLGELNQGQTRLPLASLDFGDRVSIFFLEKKERENHTYIIVLKRN